MKHIWVSVVVVAIVWVVLRSYIKISYKPEHGWGFSLDRKPFENSLMDKFLEMVRELWRKK